jgi:hypothetical protein
MGTRYSFKHLCERCALRGKIDCLDCEGDWFEPKKVKIPMTLDQAIQHALEVAEKSDTCKECGDEHKQLAEWLQELKVFKEQLGPLLNIKNLCEPNPMQELLNIANAKLMREAIDKGREQ